MPYALIEDGRLDANARWLYVCLRRRADYDDDTCYPGVPDLVRLSGLGKTTVLTSLKVLVAAGWIARTRRGQMQTNVYTVLKSATQTSTMEGAQGRSPSDGRLKSATRTLEVRETDPNENHLTKITERESPEYPGVQGDKHDGGADDAVAVGAVAALCGPVPDAPPVPARDRVAEPGRAAGQGGRRLPRVAHPSRGAAAGCGVVGVAEVWGYYRERIQPKARTYNPRKIAARLKTFTVDELKQGIDHFAADHWWMEQNASRGADWFFDKDARSEQFLNMTPRQLVASGNGHAKNGQVGKQSRSDEDKLIAYARRLGQEV